MAADLWFVSSLLFFLSSHQLSFQVGSAHPSLPTASLPKGSLKYSASLSRVLSVEYRLSAGPPIFDRRENPFPTAVIDGIAAYKYLVCEIGFLPQNIIVAGDSAGGNIALAVVRYAVESHLPDLPPPGGLIAASTPADLSYSRVGTNSSHYLNAASDIFDISPNTHFSSAKRSTFDAYIGEMDPEEIKHNRYLSPSSKFVVPPQSEVGENAKLFSGFPRSYIIGGGAELMLDDIVALAERMKDDGVDVETDFPPDAVHVYFLFPWHEPERTEAFIKCAAWLDGGHAITIVVE
jgi:acetyl esterase/lipase